MTGDGTISLARVPSLGQEHVRRVASLALKGLSRSYPWLAENSWDLDLDSLQQHCISRWPAALSFAANFADSVACRGAL